MHTTFVRSVDLDEWTQRQVDAMKLGGNDQARKFFQRHGVSDMQGKITKKYTGKAALMYKAEIQKLVEQASAARGEVHALEDALAAATIANRNTTNGTHGDTHDNDAGAQQALRTNNQTTTTTTNSITVQAKAKLASQLPGANKLATPPSSGGAPVLRKPAGSFNSKNYFKKKSSGSLGTGTLRANKLTMGTTTTTTSVETDDLNDFDKVEEGEEDQGNGNVETPVPPPAPSPVVPPEPTLAADSPSPQTADKPKVQSVQEGVARLKMMNSDFFGGI